MAPRPQPAEAFLVMCDDTDEWGTWPIAVFANREAAQARAEAENVTAKRKRKRQTYNVEPIEFHAEISIAAHPR